MNVGEFDLIARMAAIYKHRGACLDLGIGDDAAVLTPPTWTGPSPQGSQSLSSGPPSRVPAPLVWTIDEQIEGTHFRRSWLSLADVGYRAVMAAASDIAAMAASPLALLSALTLPKTMDAKDVEALAHGIEEAASALGIPVAGGNMARGPTLAVTTTVLGTSERPLPRKGAQPGDLLYVAGSLGLAAAGLESFFREDDREELHEAREAWRRPMARIREGLTLLEGAHAAIDISDGLGQDLGHLARASGVALVIDEQALWDSLPSGLWQAARFLERDPLELALRGGEDYALVAASPVPLPGFRHLGQVERGAGVLLRGNDGERPLSAEGFDHFRGSASP